MLKRNLTECVCRPGQNIIWLFNATYLILYFPPRPCFVYNLNDIKEVIFNHYGTYDSHDEQPPMPLETLCCQLFQLNTLKLFSWCCYHCIWWEPRLTRVFERTNCWPHWRRIASIEYRRFESQKVFIFCSVQGSLSLSFYLVCN